MAVEKEFHRLDLVGLPDVELLLNVLVMEGMEAESDTLARSSQAGPWGGCLHTAHRFVAWAYSGKTEYGLVSLSTDAFVVESLMLWPSGS